MEPDEPEKEPDPIADLVARMDQTHANIRELAGIIAAYYQSLVAAGFDANQGLVLTVAYQSDVIRAGRQ